MKFIFVGSEKQLILNKIGGIENIIAELSLGLIRNSHEVEFLIHSRKKIYPSAFSRQHGINEIIGSKRTIRKTILESKADYFLLLESLFQSPLFLLRFYLKSKMKNINVVKIIFTYPSIKGNKLLEKFKFRFVIHSTIVFSKRLSNDLEKFWDGEIITMLPPVSNNYFQLKNGNKNEKITIGFVGRLSSDKGIYIFKDIIDELDERKFKFIISGYYSSNEQASINIHGDNIQFEIIDQSNSENSIIAPLKDIDILVLPYQSLNSKTVDTPLLILEGLTAGCVVVTSNLESLRAIHPAIRLIDNFNNAESFIHVINNIDITSYEKPDCSEFSIDSFVTKFLKNLEA